MKLDTVILEMICMHILEMIFMHPEKGQSSVLWLKKSQSKIR